MVSYRYLVQDILTGDTLDELPLAGVSYGRGMNDEGQASGAMSLNEERVMSPAPNRHVFMVERTDDRGTDIVWAGPVSTARVDYQRQMAEFNAVSWTTWLGARFFRHDLDISGFDTITAAQTVLAYAQSPSHHGPDANYRIEVDTSQRSGATLDDNWELLAYEGRSIAEVIQAIATQDYDEDGRFLGFEYTIRSTWDQNNRERRKATFGSPRLNNRDPAFEIPLDSALVQNIGLTIDGSESGTYVVVQGSGPGEDALRGEYPKGDGFTPPTFNLGRPLREVYIPRTLIDVQRTLTSMALREGRFRSQPIIEPSLSMAISSIFPIPSIDPGVVLRLELGDYASHWGVPRFGDYRITSWSVQVQGSSEMASLTLADTSLYP
jgi:hypothetical protein